MAYICSTPKALSMKRIYLAFSCLFVLTLQAQDDKRCATDQAMANYYKKHPGSEEKRKQHDQQLINDLKSKLSSVGSYTIPVVFHILHQGGPENISDAQVIDGLNILNRDFAHLNPDTVDIIPSMKPLGDSSGIHFALATRDTNGNCTSGIIHYYDTDTDWDDSSPTIYQHGWNSTKYLNVYIVKRIILSGGFSAAGYTYFPGSWPDGHPADAIVVLNNYFGSIGTGNAFLSRVLTHEVGHWLDLYHVFGNNGAGVDCTGDDQVSDTPQTIGYTICPDKNNPAEYQTCNTGIDENFQNYMDYSYCVRMFTMGQNARMVAALNSSLSLRNNLWTNANLIATGVLNPVSPCIPVADFKANRTQTCVGVPVTFSDASWKGTPTSYTWSFPGGNPATSNVASPVVTYTAVGQYSVSYTCANSAGTATPITKANFITVVSGAPTYTSSAFSEDFESLPLPNIDWDVENSSGGAFWEQSADAPYTGIYSAKLPSVNNTRLAVSSMISPSVDIHWSGQLYLSFMLAAAESNPDHVNTLKVYISTDCKQTWTEIYSKTGAALITTTNTSTPFIPSLSEWRSEFIYLIPFSGNPSANFKFTYIRDTIPSPNNTFIDNINISYQVGVSQLEHESSFSIFPNPSTGIFHIAFDLNDSHKTEINLRDILGRTLECKPTEYLPAGKYSYSLGSVENLKRGIYFVDLVIDEKKITRKLIIE